MLLIDIWQFLKERKKWWLIPPVILLILASFLLILTQGIFLSPFIYSFF